MFLFNMISEELSLSIKVLKLNKLFLLLSKYYR